MCYTNYIMSYNDSYYSAKNLEVFFIYKIPERNIV
jgi:hypothetical protein